MVRNSQSWDLGEPELNNRGEPVIHSIAQKLGCIRADNCITGQGQLTFPEDKAGMSELVHQLEMQQDQHEEADSNQAEIVGGNSALSPMSPVDTESTDFKLGLITELENELLIVASEFSAQTHSDEEWPILSSSKSSQRDQFNDLTMVLAQETNLQSMDILTQGLLGTGFYTLETDIQSCTSVDYQDGHGQC